MFENHAHIRQNNRRSTNFFAITFLALLVVVASALPAAATDDLWLHVTIREAEEGNVTVNLPLSFVEAAIPLIPEEEFQDGKIVIEDAEFSAEDLRGLLDAVRDSPDMTFVTVQADDGDVQVSKSGAYLLVRASEPGSGEDAAPTDVDVKVPLRVVEALLEGTADNEINLLAGLRALADEGEGELATITEGQSKIRVWVDRNPEIAR